MWGGMSRILDAHAQSLRHGFWMPKLRVVALRVFDWIAGLERGVERFCEVGSSGFWPKMNGLCVLVSASGERFVPLRWRDFGCWLPRVSAQPEASRPVVKAHHVPHTCSIDLGPLKLPFDWLRHPPGGAFFVCVLPALRLVESWICEAGSSGGPRATFCHN